MIFTPSSVRSFEDFNLDLSPVLYYPVFTLLGTVTAGIAFVDVVPAIKVGWPEAPIVLIRGSVGEGLLPVVIDC